jgi:hypothetical protein
MHGDVLSFVGMAILAAEDGMNRLGSGFLSRLTHFYVLRRGVFGRCFQIQMK